MSYCRWSTDGFQCDLYCYSDGDSFWTHVSGSRYVFKEPLPEMTTDYFHWHQKVTQMCQEATLEPIGGPHDGETFTDATGAEWKATLLKLKAAGYRFPDYVIEQADAIARDEAIPHN